MIRLDSLNFAYAKTQPGAPPVFNQYNWQVKRGQSWAVLGPSGCGKTTLLYLLAGLIFPTSGWIAIDGQPLSRPRPRTGLILQEYGLLPWATVRQNAELGWRVRDFYGPDATHAPTELTARQQKAEYLSQVSAWLERVGLTAVQHQYPSQVSGGQRQRTAIARTLSLQPDLLLMDEPFSSLDAPTRSDLQRLIIELWQEQNLTLVVVTHSIEESAILGQKILLLSQPPNEQPIIIDNPGAMYPGFQETRAYLDLCRVLRQRLELL